MNKITFKMSQVKLTSLVSMDMSYIGHEPKDPCRKVIGNIKF